MNKIEEYPKKNHFLTILTPTKATKQLSWSEWTPNAEVSDYLWQLKADLKNNSIDTIDFVVERKPHDNFTAIKVSMVVFDHETAERIRRGRILENFKRVFTQ